MNYLSLQKKYPVFEYKSYLWRIIGDDLEIVWEMTANELAYQPTVIIKNAAQKAEQLDQKVLDNLVFHLGLADIFSYWKPTCSPLIRISAGSLNKDQIDFWKNLLIKGMGQYFWENGIDFRGNFVEFESLGSSLADKYNAQSDKVLIPVGGGKDSAVTLELLKKFNPGALILETFQPRLAARLLTNNVTETIFVERRLDQKMLNLDKNLYLNGHVPITAYISFLAILISALFGYGQVAFSNERSSNEGNGEYLGFQINHQYSKSFEFEKMFAEYNHNYLSNLNYFSFLRPLYELQIIKLFSKMPQYFDDFRSCNVGLKTNSWCGKCPKCMSTYAGLTTFVSKAAVDKIFGGEIKVDIDRLLARPFECIGTVEETRAALGLPGSDLQKILEGWDENNLLPKKYAEVLKIAYEAS